MTSIEQKILTCAMKQDADSSQHQKLQHLMSHDIDADSLIHTAVKEGLAGLLYKALMKSGALETFEHNQREKLQSLYYRTVLLNQKLIQDLKEVLVLLNQEGIHVVLLQGIALLQEVYDDIGLRPMSDIDLWVLKEDYHGLVNILVNKGYERDPAYPNTFRKGTTIFDFHTHILWADRIKAYRLILAKDQDYIYRDTRVINFEGQEARCLSKYDQVLYLSLHALKHYVEKLIWLVDIKKLITGWK
ncbi:MAG: nucleotidyltransferase family protein, partial [Candidatus Aminicenantaceae bacterium]